MRAKTFLLSLLLLSASFASAGAPVPIHVAPTIPYASPAVGWAVSPGPECAWDASLIAYLVKYGGGRVATHPTPMDAQGQKLILTARLGPNVGEGEKAAPSWIEVTGMLLDENGKPLGDFGFRDERYSGSLYQCKRAIRLAEGLADNIVNWLAEPKPGIKIAETISVFRDDTIDPEIKRTCPWDTELPAYVSGMFSGNVYRVAGNLEAARGKRLLLTIVTSPQVGRRPEADELARAPLDMVSPPQVKSGAKWLKVTGSLMDDDREIGSFIASRRTIRGSKGCDISNRLSYQVAYDMYNWLQSPTMNARLGDADASTDALP
jgi:glutaredoxin-related protein